MKQRWLSVLTLLGFLLGCGGGGGNSSNGFVRHISGLNFSPYVTGSPQNGTDMAAAAKLLAKVSDYAFRIRIFSVSDAVGQQAVASNQVWTNDVTVYAGCWLSRDLVANEREVTALIAAVKKYKVFPVVGSEVLQRGDLTETQLIDYVKRVKTATTTKVAVCDTYNQLLNHPKVMEAADLVLANFYPYWEGVSIKQAMATLNTQYFNLRHQTNKPIQIGETGWPSAGNKVGDAVASTENAAQFFLEFVTWADAVGVEYFYFETNDEPWKAASEGPQGAHWGLLDTNLNLKLGMDRPFKGEKSPDTWSGKSQWSGKIAFRNSYGAWIVTPTTTKTIANPKAYFRGMLRWSPNGQYLAFDTNNDNVFCLDDGNGSLLKTYDAGDNNFSWLPDSSGFLAGVYFQGIYLFLPDGRRKELIYSFDRTYDHNPVQSLDGKWVYFVHSEFGSTATIYRIKTADLLREVHNLNECEQIATYGWGDDHTQLAPVENGLIVIGHGDTTELLDPETKQVKARIDSPTVQRVAASPDGKMVAIQSSGDGGQANHYTVVLNASNLSSFDSLGEMADGLAWSPDGKYLAVQPLRFADASNQLAIWRLADHNVSLVYNQTRAKGQSKTRSLGDWNTSISWTK